MSSNYQINDFMRQIGTFKSGRARLAIDYEKLLKTKFSYFLIITERETRVKTYGAKQLLYSKWNKVDPIGLWLRTLASDVDSEKTSFFSDTPDYMKEEGFSFEKDMAVNSQKLPFLLLSSVATPSRVRGSRILLDYIVWDEFNIGVDGKNFKKLNDNFSDIIRSTSNSTTARKQKVFLLGNNKSFNHPLLISMGITSIKEEITEIYTDEGHPLMLVLFPIIDENERKLIMGENADNPQFQLLSLLNGADHSYFNETQFDKVNGVVEYTTLSDMKFWQELSFRTDEDVVMCFFVPKEMRSDPEQMWFFIRYELYKKKFKRNDDTNWLNVPLLSQKAMTQNQDLPIDTFLKNNLLKFLVKNQCSFYDISTKNLFVKTFK